MILIPDSWGEDLVEFNPCHNPPGPGGGQFCSTGGSTAQEEPGLTRPRLKFTDPMAGRVELSDRAHYNVHFREEDERFLKHGQTLAAAQVSPGEVDLAVEHRAVAATFTAAEDFWTSNDPDVRVIKRADRDYVEPRHPRELSAMLVMTLSIGDYGMGSGGPGSAKVFWGPYSAPNRRERLKTENDRKAMDSQGWDRSYADSLGVDPVGVLAHELHHAWGANSEFDLGSEVVALDTHLKLKLYETDVAVKKGMGYALYGMVANMGRRSVYKRALRYLYKRNPESLRRVVSELRPGEWDRIQAEFMVVGKRKPVKVSEARRGKRGLAVGLGVVRCRRAHDPHP